MQRKNIGTLHFQAEEVKNLKQSVSFNLSCRNLPAMDFFSRKSDPYVIIYRGAQANLKISEEELKKQRIPVYKTEVGMGFIGSFF